jgi:DNA-binding beta-propeller fold protein YncE
MPPGCASASCVTTLGGGFNGPKGVAVDGSGNVYVADTGNNLVKEMPAGAVPGLTTLRRRDTSTSCMTLPGCCLGDNPRGVAVDGSGNVYVTGDRYEGEPGGSRGDHAAG